MTRAVLGALLFLEDTQVRDRPGRRSSEFDATDVGDGAKSRIFLNVPFTNRTFSIPPLPGFKVKNKVGEWVSDAHGIPKRFGYRGRALLSVPDSNMFMTAMIAYPLFFLEDEGGRIAGMRRLAVENVKTYKRGPAYSFWSELPGTRSPAPRVGPPNMSTTAVEVLGAIGIVPVVGTIWRWMLKGLELPPDDWVRRLFNPAENPTGVDAAFNVPNDADDTAVAVAIQLLHERSAHTGRGVVDLSPLDRVARFRDLGRVKEDGRDAWKGKDSGAFLTWLRDENEPTFGKPEEGVIPLDVNNVDVVVNANVLFALALAGRKEAPGYREALRTVIRAIERKVWDKAGLYYPQHMMFPYAVSRAYRDGGAADPELRTAMKSLLTQILDERDALAAREPTRSGAFPGGKDRSYDLSTALGVVTLLNIGRDLAREAGEERRYDRALAEGVRYLLDHRRPYEARNPETLKTPWAKALGGGTGSVWESGLFFAASFHDLAQWRSRAYTTAIALEALAKYLLGHDRMGLAEIGSGSDTGPGPLSV